MKYHKKETGNYENIRNYATVQKFRISIIFVEKKLYIISARMHSFFFRLTVKTFILL